MPSLLFSCEDPRLSRSILRLTPSIRVRRLSTRVELSVPGRLCRSWQTIAGNHMSSAGVQSELSESDVCVLSSFVLDKISRKFLSPTRQSRMCIDQSYLRVLRRMQTTIQHQTMENIHRLFQLSSSRGHHRREDLLLSRWPQSRSPVDGANQTHHAADGRARPRSAL